MRKSFRLLSCAASRFWLTTGFGRVGRAANLLTDLAGADGDDDHEAGMGDDWISLRTLASHADSGGGVVARMGLEDSGEETAGRWADGEDRAGGAWAAKSGKIGGRPIVVNMTPGGVWSTAAVDVVQDGRCIGLRSARAGTDASVVFVF